MPDNFGYKRTNKMQDILNKIKELEQMNKLIYIPVDLEKYLPEMIAEAKKKNDKDGLGKYLVNLHIDRKDRKELINQILTCINDGDTITTAMLESWGQDEYHINHRPKS